MQHRALRGRFPGPCALTANVDGKPLCSAPGSFPTRAGRGFGRPEQIFVVSHLLGELGLFFQPDIGQAVCDVPLYINHGKLLENDFCK